MDKFLWSVNLSGFLILILFGFGTLYGQTRRLELRVSRNNEYKEEHGNKWKSRGHRSMTHRKLVEGKTVKSLWGTLWTYVLIKFQSIYRRDTLQSPCVSYLTKATNLVLY